MKKTICSLLLAACACTVSAQEESNVLNVSAEIRVDYLHEYLEGEFMKSKSGFRGKYLNVMIDGDINKHFSYAYKQRLNRMHKEESFFDATDWIYLTYNPNEQWSISAGKQVVGIGGYEYDRSPIDLYFCSEYWNNISCYQFGASVTYKLANGKDRFFFQACESPYRAYGDFMFAYNLMWYGSHEWFNTIYSLNMTEYQPGEYIYYVVLGNEFKMGDFTLQLDFMNRATDKHAFFFKDFSVMGELSYMIRNKVNVFAKMTYDVNNADVAGDYSVMPGTEVTRVGAGIEYFPLPKGNKDIRIFADYCYTYGKNGNVDGALLDKQSIVDVGVRWDIDFVSLTRKIFKKNDKKEI